MYCNQKLGEYFAKFCGLLRLYELYYIGQIYGGDFAKICGLLRIYELYNSNFHTTNYLLNLPMYSVCLY